MVIDDGFVALLALAERRRYELIKTEREEHNTKLWE
jgi:hypothetical protein